MSVAEVMEGKFSLPFEPEYERDLDTVLLGIQDSADPRWWNGINRMVDALPDYSRVMLLLPPDDRSPTPAAQNDLLRKLAGRSRQGIIVRSPQEYWIQDLGEGTAGLILLGGNGLGDRQIFHQMGLATAWHYLPLEGGNIQLARNHRGQRIVFIGEKEHELAGRELARRRIVDPERITIESYRHTFSADRVMILPVCDRELHIDQSVLFLRDGLAAVEVFDPLTAAEQRLVEVCWSEMRTAGAGERRKREAFGPEYRGPTKALVQIEGEPGRFRETTATTELTDGEAAILARFRKQRPDMFDLLYRAGVEHTRIRTERILQDLGFDVLRLKTTVWHHLNRQSYVNGMAYRDRATGRASVLLPVYHEPGENPKAVDLHSLRGENRANRDILVRAGLNVRPVQSVFRMGGNLHCMMYQLPAATPDRGS